MATGAAKDKPKRNHYSQKGFARDGARLGPGIIDKQVAIIGEIEAELANQDDARARGFRERLQHARRFYGNLRKGMA